MGPFETLGGSKTVVLSYTFLRKYIIENAASWTGSSSTTVQLQRSTDGSSWTTVATLSPTGNITSQDGFGEFEPGHITITNSGSVTYTDNTAATSNLYFRANMTARAVPTINSTIQYVEVDSQRTAVVSTEP